ncbi:hypothetical protein BJY00DRAFT_278346 [Aspergillus carlsbadensis]|nr:hypothetical protein BJY00DRAFT_278346 [Aspergillus carlsbadensis]
MPERLKLGLVGGFHARAVLLHFSLQPSSTPQPAQCAVHNSILCPSPDSRATCLMSHICGCCLVMLSVVSV